MAVDREAAFVVVRAVAAKLGLDHREIELLGPIADNAVFRLPGRTVVRIATSAAGERALREVRTGRWLATQGLPAVQPLESIQQPLSVDGHVVTLWHEIPEASIASTSELAVLLRQLHRLPIPTDFDVPVLNPFVRLNEHLKAAESELSPSDRDFLANRLEELKVDYASVSDGLRVCVIHGDANRKNAIRGSDSRAVLLDLERFSIGPRQWDLVVPAVYQRLGWYSDSEYAAFVEAYGWDVRSWSGFETYTALREFRMTAWLLSRLTREPRLRNEAANRLASLREPDAPRSWTPGT
ncbi:phosphotransferase family protein [Kribbella sindirgiensis]|uniref:Aminoglycoside phosphotransferase family protein n=1 Tax=Kribbella sindirgiensis TaxID=1124744 RepID=A0A4R0JG15_9ACTN|nr:aminoglycoside phosphotransferase family protein [Kribbella sindirgiensis]TCC43596.1 aminoglycoside phosphotransferase family protein [Kribbella sindirgiensis]